MKIRKFHLPLMILVSAVIGFYLSNPSGTNTWDPRGRLFGFMKYRIPSGSMSPTLLPGDFIITNTFTYINSPRQRGDVVVFTFSTQPNINFVKRIVGVEGDHIKLDGDALYINGVRQTEPYLTPYNENARRSNYETTVLPGRLFMLGDNRQNSSDSRVRGQVPSENVIGRVSHIWWSDDLARTGAVWHNRARKERAPKL